MKKTARQLSSYASGLFATRKQVPYSAFRRGQLETSCVPRPGRKSYSKWLRSEKNRKVRNLVMRPDSVRESGRVEYDAR